MILAGLEKALGLLPRGPIKLLDVGCADGHILNWFRQARTHQVETYGVDMNTAAVERAVAQGHKALVGRFEDIELPAGSFDFIFASHVIEHVSDPKAFARKAFELLKPGGIFWFWTPNIDSVDAKWFADRHWGAYHFPRHWVFYSPSTIARLAELSGFRLELITYEPNAIFWVWTFHSILKANPSLKNHADKLFPPIDWAKTTMPNLIRNAFFAGVDMVIKVCSGQTSNMGVAFRKPKGETSP